MEPIEQLADLKMIELAADVQVQLENGTATRPVLYMLVRARVRAAKAFDLFIDVDPVADDEIRRLQAELRLYNDLVEACRDMINLGKEASGRITEEERAELEEVVMQMTDEQRRLYQFEPRSRD